MLQTSLIPYPLRLYTNEINFDFFYRFSSKPATIQSKIWIVILFGMRKKKECEWRREILSNWSERKRKDRLGKVMYIHTHTRTRFFSSYVLLSIIAWSYKFIGLKINFNWFIDIKHEYLMELHWMLMYYYCSMMSQWVVDHVVVEDDSIQNDSMLMIDLRLNLL